MVKYLLVLCLISGTAYVLDYDDYIRRSQDLANQRLQTSIMQDQVNVMWYKNQETTIRQAPSRSYNVDRIERPTYVIDKPLYKFGE